ncbi:MAG: hypothetical protein KDC52_11760, partial [Ignavibacteriae bacterium]|nr:hypothetical protein [Ignavibacteriota bacterium]
GGVGVTLFLGYIACALACNGMGILAIFVFFGGELLYAILATQIIKKYWKKWRVKGNEVN